jgi:hypothetical protein
MSDEPLDALVLSGFLDPGLLETECTSAEVIREIALKRQQLVRELKKDVSPQEVHALEQEILKLYTTYCLPDRIEISESLLPRGLRASSVTVLLDRLLGGVIVVDMQSKTLYVYDRLKKAIQELQLQDRQKEALFHRFRGVLSKGPQGLGVVYANFGFLQMEWRRDSNIKFDFFGSPESSLRPGKWQRVLSALMHVALAVPVAWTVVSAVSLGPWGVISTVFAGGVQILATGAFVWMLEKLWRKLRRSKRRSWITWGITAIATLVGIACIIYFATSTAAVASFLSSLSESLSQFIVSLTEGVAGAVTLLLPHLSFASVGSSIENVLVAGLVQTLANRRCWSRKYILALTAVAYGVLYSMELLKQLGLFDQAVRKVNPLTVGVQVPEQKLVIDSNTTKLVEFGANGTLTTSPVPLARERFINTSSWEMCNITQDAQNSSAIGPPLLPLYRNGEYVLAATATGRPLEFRVNATCLPLDRFQPAEPQEWLSQMMPNNGPPSQPTIVQVPLNQTYYCVQDNKTGLIHAPQTQTVVTSSNWDEFCGPPANASGSLGGLWNNVSAIPDKTVETEKIISTKNSMLFGFIPYMGGGAMTAVSSWFEGRRVRAAAATLSAVPGFLKLRSQISESKDSILS